MNFNNKAILKFLGLFLLFYLLLNVLIPLAKIDTVFQNTFKTIAQTAFKNYNKVGIIEFLDKVPKQHKTNPFGRAHKKLYVKMMNQQQYNAAIAEAKRQRASSVNINHAEFELDLWQFFWIPAILLMALTLATPITLKQKLIAFILGLLTFELFTGFRFWVRFTTEINRHGWLQLGTLGTNGKWLVTHLNTILMFIGVSMAVAAIVWAIFAASKVNYKGFLEED